MTPLQKRIILLLSIVIGLTRLLAVARSLFDWDEALFSLGVREYDMAVQHPHPPGYPLFIAAAKLVHLLGVPEFRSLQVVVLLGAFCIFPALFFLAREIGFDFATSASGAAIFAFLPNVWIYGGTGFSDVPATALAFGACAMLLRGRRDARAYIVGAILLGAAAGIRPTNLLIGAIPALLATWHRVKARTLGTVAVAILLGGAVVAGCYAGSVFASSSVDGYVSSLRSQSKWVRDVDSWHNPGRPPLSAVAKTFFLFPVDQHNQMIGLAIFGIASLVAAIVKRRGAPLLTLAIFVPAGMLTWLNLDVNTAGRYAISYMAVHALLAADGLRLTALAFAGRRSVSATPKVQAALTFVVVSVFVVWTWPALRTQRKTDAPPAAALEWVKRNVPPSSTVYVHSGLGPQAEFLLHDHKVAFFESREEIPLMAGESWIVDLPIVQDGMNFVLPHNSLWKIIRRRNFETSLSRVSSLVHFGEGWYDQEGEEGNSFRWMARDAHASLPTFPGQGRLSMRIYAPIDAIPPPTIEVFMNGSVVARWVATAADNDRSWIVASRPGALNEMRIVTSGSVNPSRSGHSSDTRDLGLRLDALTWTPVR